MKLGFVLGGALAAVLLVGGAATVSAQQDAAAPAAAEPAAATVVPLSGIQIGRGRTVVGESCAECHGVTLRGALGPPLRDAPFQVNWSGRSVQALYDFIHGAMPPAAPGTLTEAQYVDVISFILSVNGFITEEGAPELVLNDLAELAIP